MSERKCCHGVTIVRWNDKHSEVGEWWLCADLADARARLAAVEKAHAEAVAAWAEYLGKWKEAVEALRRMMDTHGAHGPCRGNGCSECRAAHKRAARIVAAKCGTCGGDGTAMVREGKSGPVIATVPCPDCASGKETR